MKLFYAFLIFFVQDRQLGVSFFAVVRDGHFSRGPNGYTVLHLSHRIHGHGIFPYIDPTKINKNSWIGRYNRYTRPMDPFDFRIDVLIETWIRKYDLKNIPMGICHGY